MDFFLFLFDGKVNFLGKDMRNSNLGNTVRGEIIVVSLEG